MKKMILSIVSMVCMVLMVVAPSFAVNIADDDEVETTENEILVDTVYYADGSYTEYFVSVPKMSLPSLGISTASTKKEIESSNKAVYSDGGVKQWYINLHATFEYDGTTVTVTDERLNRHLYNNNWTKKSKNVYHVGGTVYGSAVFQKNDGTRKSESVKITCSKNGTITK